MCTVHTRLTGIKVCPLPSRNRVLHCSGSGTSSLHQHLAFERDLCLNECPVLPPSHSARCLQEYFLEATGARRQHLATPSTALPQPAGSRLDAVDSLPPAQNIANPRILSRRMQRLAKLGVTKTTCSGGRTARCYEAFGQCSRLAVQRVCA